MPSAEAVKHFNDFLDRKGIRHSARREEVLEVFLKCERHITVSEFFELVHRKFPRIGIATVYRTLKLITEAGIARAIEFGDGILRYEHDFGHEHHDHIVCVKCGVFQEINNGDIEKAQESIACNLGFSLLRHKMVLYGICPKCLKEKSVAAKSELSELF